MVQAEEAPGSDDDWVATHINRSPPHRPTDMDEIPDIPGSPTAAPTREMAGLNVSSGGKLEEDEIPDIDDIPDMDEEGLEDLEDDAAVKIVHPSEAEVNSTAGKNLLQVRTYDCIISYDKHYQTPRFWLFGYDEVSLFIYTGISCSYEGQPYSTNTLLPLPKYSRTSRPTMLLRQ